MNETINDKVLRRKMKVREVEKITWKVNFLGSLAQVSYRPVSYKEKRVHRMEEKLMQTTHESLFTGKKFIYDFASFFPWLFVLKLLEFSKICSANKF